MAVLVNDGRKALAEYLTAQSGNYKFGLYTNNPGINAGTVMGDLTEATYSGYARQNTTFSPVAINGDGKAEATVSPVTFTHNGGIVSQVINGWFVYDTNKNKLIWCQPLAAPRSMGASGDEITIDPTFLFSQLP